MCVMCDAAAGRRSDLHVELRDHNQMSTISLCITRHTGVRSHITLPTTANMTMLT